MSIDWEDWEQRAEWHAQQAREREPVTGCVWVEEQREREAAWAKQHLKAHPTPRQRPVSGPSAPETPTEAINRLVKRERALLGHLRNVWVRSRKADRILAGNPTDRGLIRIAEQLRGQAHATERDDRRELAEINQRLQDTAVRRNDEEREKR